MLIHDVFAVLLRPTIKVIFWWTSSSALTINRKLFIVIFDKSITTLQLFKKKISYRTLWCIISLPTKYTKESDPVRQTHYTTKRTWLVDFINIFPSILKRFLPLPRRLYFYWLYPYLPWNRRIPSVPSIDIFCLASPKSHWLLFIMPVPTPKQTIPDSWM